MERHLNFGKEEGKDSLNLLNELRMSGTTSEKEREKGSDDLVKDCKKRMRCI